MKKTLVTISSLLVAASCFAQFGFKAGLSSSKVNMGDFKPSYFNQELNVKEELSKATGFHAGPLIHLSPIDALGIETGLIFSMRGYEQPVETESTLDNAVAYAETFKSTMYYFDIPLTLSYKYKIVGPLKVFAEAGPYLAFGLFGKNKYTSNESGSNITVEEAIKWGTNAEDELKKKQEDIEAGLADPIDAMLGYKRLDYGATFGGGVILAIVKVGIGYDLGLANINPYTVMDTYKDAEIKNRVFRVYVALGKF